MLALCATGPSRRDKQSEFSVQKVLRSRAVLFDLVAFDPASIHMTHLTMALTTVFLWIMLLAEVASYTTGGGCMLQQLRWTWYPQSLKIRRIFEDSKQDLPTPSLSKFGNSYS